MAEMRAQKNCGIGIRGVAMTIDAVAWFLLFILAGTIVGAVTGQMEVTATGLDTDLEGSPALVSLGLWLGLSLSIIPRSCG